MYNPTDRELGYPKLVQDTLSNFLTSNFRILDKTSYKPKNRPRLESIIAWLLVIAQFVEYKLSHYIEKTFESAFGFISVLPGAFSTFR